MRGNTLFKLLDRVDYEYFGHGSHALIRGTGKVVQLRPCGALDVMPDDAPGVILNLTPGQCRLRKTALVQRLRIWRQE